MRHKLGKSRYQDSEAPRWLCEDQVLDVKDAVKHAIIFASVGIVGVALLPFTAPTAIALHTYTYIKRKGCMDSEEYP